MGYTSGMGPWALNFFQIEVTKINEEMMVDIRRPVFEYGLFITFKTAEIASFVGGLIVHPLYRCYLLKTLKEENRTRNSKNIIRNSCRRIQGRFLLAGLALGPIMTVTYVKTSGVTRDDLRRCCYDIRYNRDHLHLDRMSLMMGLIGWYWRRFQGAVDGINVAFGYFLLKKTVLGDRLDSVFIDKLTVPPENSQQLLNQKPLGARLSEGLDRHWWKSEK